MKKHIWLLILVLNFTVFASYQDSYELIKQLGKGLIDTINTSSNPLEKINQIINEAKNKNILQQVVNFDSGLGDQRSPILVALKKNNIPVVELLLKNGLNHAVYSVTTFNQATTYLMKQPNVSIVYGGHNDTPDIWSIIAKTFTEENFQNNQIDFEILSLIAQQHPLNEIEQDKPTILDRVLSYGNSPHPRHRLISWLLKNGAQINQIKNFNACLDIALRSQDLSLIKSVLKLKTMDNLNSFNANYTLQDLGHTTVNANFLPLAILTGQNPTLPEWASAEKSQKIEFANKLNTEITARNFDHDILSELSTLQAVNCLTESNRLNCQLTAEISYMLLDDKQLRNDAIDHFDELYQTYIKKMQERFLRQSNLTQQETEALGQALEVRRQEYIKYIEDNIRANFPNNLNKIYEALEENRRKYNKQIEKDIRQQFSGNSKKIYNALDYARIV